MGSDGIAVLQVAGRVRGNGRNVAERKRGAGSHAGRPGWQTVGAGCTEACLQAHLKAISALTSTDVIRPKRSRRRELSALIRVARALGGKPQFEPFGYSNVRFWRVVLT